MISFKTLKWSDCFSYGPDNVLDLDANTVTQIIGVNGSGKSSIPTIIEEVLFNKNSKGIKKAEIPNRYINNGYKISLTFKKDEDEYEVVVARKANIKVSLSKNGEDISSHTATGTYGTIEELLGVDFKTFSQLVYQSTNASLQFLVATDTTRKKFLIDLLHLESYVALFDVFKNASKTVSTEVTSIESRINTIQKWLESNILTDTSILPMLNLEINTEEDEKEFRHLTKEIENISEKNKKIIKNNQYKKLLNQIDLREIQGSEIPEERSYDTLQEELGQINAVITSSNQLLKKLTGLGDTCPTCEQPVDSDFKESLIEIEKLKLVKAEVENDRINQLINEIKSRNATIRNKRKLQRDWEELYRSIDQTLPSSLLDEEQLRVCLERVRQRLQDAKTSLADIAKQNEERTKRNTRIQIILEQTDKFALQLKEADAALEKTEELLSNLEVLKKAFSTNGLLAYKIENLVKDLEEVANSYLGELSGGRFTLEFILSNDKLNVQITDNGNTVDILALSSGEFARVNTATLLAIRRIMSSISKSRINVLFLDEVINVLDQDGREKLVEILLQEEDLNTYVVSHGWTHPLLEKVEVVKENEISRLEK
jgi:DNA repair exonuclease SbcCD ATPase subunit